MYLAAEANTIKGTTWCYLNNTRNWFSLWRSGKQKTPVIQGEVWVHLAFVECPRRPQTLIGGFIRRAWCQTLAGESRKRRLAVVAPGFWRHRVTLALRHQHQLPRTSREAGFSCLGTQRCVPVPAAKQETHEVPARGVCVCVCICVLVSSD